MNRTKGEMSMKEYEVVAAIEAVAKKYYGSTSFFTIFTKNGHIITPNIYIISQLYII